MRNLINGNTRLAILGGGAFVTDLSPVGHAITVTGNVLEETTAKKFVESSGKFSGGLNDYLSLPYSSDFTEFGWKGSGGTQYESWTLDAFVKISDLTKSPWLFSKGNSVSTLNYWRLAFNAYSGTKELYFVMREGGVNKVQLSSPGNIITDSDWHHIAVVKKIFPIPVITTFWGLYVDGVQVAFCLMSAGVSTDAQPIYIGSNPLAAGGGGNSLDGYINDLRLQRSNIFGADPNVGLTDTITVPTEDFSKFIRNTSSIITAH